MANRRVVIFLTTILFSSLLSLSYGMRDLEIVPAGDMPNVVPLYVFGEPIALRMILINLGPDEVLTFLNYHENEDKTDEICGLTVRVVEDSGKVLTRHDIFPSDPGRSDWWTFKYLESTAYEMGSDGQVSSKVHILDPGTSASCIFRLDKVLRDAPGLSGPLVPGYYDVQVSYDQLTSNILRIQIVNEIQK